MSAHYRSREPSGCIGCIAVVLMVLGTPVVLGLACWELVSRLAG